MSPRDPGLQPERTLLAWRRVVLTLLGLAAALPGLARPGLAPLSLAAAAVLAVAALLLLARARRGYRPADPTRHEGSPAALLATAVITVAVGVAALLVVLDHTR